MFLIQYFKRFVIFAIVLAMVAAGALVWQIPAYAAYICPTCFGLKQVADNIYVEKSMSDRQVKRILRLVKASHKNVTRFYKNFNYHPMMLFCESDLCDKDLGGEGAVAMTHGYHLIRFARLGTTQTIITHELSHIETHGRVGLIKLLQNTVPHWMDEGLAVIVSRDKRFLRLNGGSGFDCLTSIAHLNKSGKFYAHATCRTLKQFNFTDQDKTILKIISQKR